MYLQLDIGQINHPLHFGCTLPTVGRGAAHPGGPSWPPPHPSLLLLGLPGSHGNRAAGEPQACARARWHMYSGGKQGVPALQVRAGETGLAEGRPSKVWTGALAQLRRPDQSPPPVLAPPPPQGGSTALAPDCRSLDQARGWPRVGGAGLLGRLPCRALPPPHGLPRWPPHLERRLTKGQVSARAAGPRAPEPAAGTPAPLCHPGRVAWALMCLLQASSSLQFC